MDTQVFRGPQALADYLRPDVERYTPLCELPAALNPFLETNDVHVYVKLLNTLPLANVKSIPAWNMLERTDTNLHGMNVVESSSGNTVFSLGILAGHFGVKKVRAVASKDVSRGKLNLLRLAGIDVQVVDGPLCPSPNDPKSSITIAAMQGRQSGWYNPGQYDNDANPEAHMRYTGPQIFAQLEGGISMFVAGLGTTGTLVGTARYLRRHKPDVTIVGAVRAPNNAVPGVRTENGLDEVAFDWKESVTTKLVRVNEYESYEKSLALIRQGLLVGPSAGFAYAATLKHLAALKAAGHLDTLRGKNVVFIAPDSMFPYVDEYFAVLGPHYFGAIDDQSSGEYKEATSELGGVAELSVDDVYDDYDMRRDEPQSRHYQIVDIREPSEYLDHHLPDSINVPLDELDEWLEKASPDKPLVFVCRRGSTSLRAAKQASQKDFQSFSMTGGTAEWSDKDYPRVRPLFCQ